MAKQRVVSAATSKTGKATNGFRATQFKQRKNSRIKAIAAAKTSAARASRFVVKPTVVRRFRCRCLRTFTMRCACVSSTHVCVFWRNLCPRTWPERCPPPLAKDPLTPRSNQRNKKSLCCNFHGHTNARRQQPRKAARQSNDSTATYE